MTDENRKGRGSRHFSEERNGPIMVDISQLIDKPKPGSQPKPASKPEPEPEKTDE